MCVSYAQSKTANIWFGMELQRRHGDRITSLSVHPGVIMTDLARHLTQADIEEMGASFGDRGITFKTIPQGAATSVWAATAAELADQGGRYLADCQVATPLAEDNQTTGYAPWAYDEAGAQHLWTVSEELTGVSFP